MPRRSTASCTFALLLLLVGACASQSPAQRPADFKSPFVPLALDYDVAYSRSPHLIEVRVTLDGPARDFMFTQRGYVDEVIATVPGGERSLSVERDGRVVVPAGTTALRYRYDIRRFPLFRMADLYTGAGEAGSFLVAGRAYLIRPRVADQVIATLRFRGVDVLTPWSPLEDGNYRVRGSDLVDSGFHSFGGRRCEAQVPGGKIVMAIHQGELRVSDSFLCEWIRRSALEVLTVRPELPHDRVAVHLVPGWGSAPSPLGLMLHSAPPSLAIVVGARAEEQAFTDDWVAVHELLHLLHPSFMGDAPWVTEGLATYYTEVARMRAGRLSEDEGWRRLAEGFARGRDEAEGRTLDESVAALRQGVYLPVYWAGALIALELDVAIRETTSNRASLDDVLTRLLSRGSAASLAELKDAVDAIAGTPVFEPVLARHREGPVLRDTSSVLRRLGVIVEGEGVRLTDDGEQSDLRKRLTRLGRGDRAGTQIETPPVTP